jgi:hypothetical protein
MGKFRMQNLECRMQKREINHKKHKTHKRRGGFYRRERGGGGGRKEVYPQITQIGTDFCKRRGRVFRQN